MRSRWHVLAVIVLVLLFAACGAADEAPDSSIVCCDRGGALLVLAPLDELGDRPADLILFMSDVVLSPEGEGGLPKGVEDMMWEVAEFEGVLAVEFFSKQMAAEEYEELLGDDARSALDDPEVLPTSLRVSTASNEATDALSDAFKDDARVLEITVPPARRWWSGSDGLVDVSEHGFTITLPSDWWAEEPPGTSPDAEFAAHEQANILNTLYIQTLVSERSGTIDEVEPMMEEWATAAMADLAGVEESVSVVVDRVEVSGYEALRAIAQALVDSGTIETHVYLVFGPDQSSHMITAILPEPTESNRRAVESIVESFQIVSG